MNLTPYVETIRSQLLASAEAGGDEARELANRLTAPLEAAVRLALQDVLAAAAEEITCDLAPGSVELRLRGRDPEFVVTAPPAAPTDESDVTSTMAALGSDGDDPATARINLRLPEPLKARVDAAAANEALSTNSWLLRAAARALDRSEPERGRAQRASMGGQRYTGWAR